MNDTFGNLLEQYYKDSGYSLGSFAKMVGINKGTLHGVVTGERKLDEEKLYALIDGGVFSAIRCQRLLDAYFSEIYGKQNFERMKYLLARYTAMPEAERPLQNLPFSAAPEKGRECVSSAEEVYRAVCALFAQTAQSENPVLYTNYSFADQELDDIVFACAAQFGHAVDLHHLLIFSDENRSLSNWQMLFSSVRYARLDCNSFFRIAEHDTEKSDVPFPYYFLSEGVSLLLRRDGKGGILLRGDAAAELFAHMKEVCAQYEPLYLFCDNLLQLHDAIFSQAELIREDFGVLELRAEPCMLSAADYDFFDAIAVRICRTES